MASNADNPSSRPTPRALPPEELNDLHLTPPKGTAAGMAAIVSTVKHIREEMGSLRGMKALSQVNQHGGFDCPGCAWPDPANRRSSLGEFCENGAKAVAEEATIKRVTPGFFPRIFHSKTGRPIRLLAWQTRPAHSSDDPQSR